MENRKRSGVSRDGDAPRKFFKPVNRPNKEDFVFGMQSVLETLKSDKEIDKLLLQKELKHFEEIEILAKQRGVPIQRVRFGKSSTRPVTMQKSPRSQSLLFLQ